MQKIENIKKVFLLYHALLKKKFLLERKAAIIRRKLLEKFDTERNFFCCLPSKQVETLENKIDRK